MEKVTILKFLERIPISFFSKYEENKFFSLARLKQRGKKFILELELKLYGLLGVAQWPKILKLIVKPDSF